MRALKLHTLASCDGVTPVYYPVPEVMPSLSCSHAFLLEFQAVSPGYRIVVQLKWHSINFIDSMEICVR